MQTLIGRIATEGKINNVKGDKQVVNFSIALNNNYKTKEGEKRETTTFVNCAYWRSTGITEYLKKGTLVEVSGHLSANAYTNSQGKPAASINFHTNEITLHGKAKSEEAPKRNDVASPFRAASSASNAVRGECCWMGFFVAFRRRRNLATQNDTAYGLSVHHHSGGSFFSTG